MAQHEVVILGGNFAGLDVAHYLLLHTFPALQQLSSTHTHHLTLVTPNDSFLFKVGAPRALVAPHLIPQEKLYIPISEGFSTYSTDQFTFEQGVATGLDEKSRTITIKQADNAKGDSKELRYNFLVIASGTTGSPLWTITDDLSATRAAYAEMHKKIPTAESILVAGGGPAGVETVGELASFYPNKKIVLVPGSERVLPRLSTKTSSRAESMLKAMGVEIKSGVHVSSAKEGGEGGWEVVFDDGSSRTVDLYIPATGAVPNTDFLPKSWLDEHSRVITDNVNLRVTNTLGGGVYAIGDVATYSSRGLFDVVNGLRPLCGALGSDASKLVSKDGEGTASKVLKEKKFWTIKDSQLVPIGPKGGVGQVLGWGIPSFLVWLVKSRTFFLERSRGPVMGDNAKAA